MERWQRAIILTALLLAGCGHAVIIRYDACVAVGPALSAQTVVQACR